MITTRIAAAIATGALAVGILVGSAGTIVVRDAAAPQTADWAAHMGQMSSMMNSAGGMMNGANGTGGMMNGAGGTGGMMNGAGGTGGMMNGTGGMMNGANGTDPSATSTPGGMLEHHATAAPVVNP